jgi:hypothetical protein
MLSPFIAFVAGFVLCCLLVPSVRAAIFAVDDMLDMQEQSLSKVAARESPFGLGHAISNSSHEDRVPFQGNWPTRMYGSAYHAPA